MPIHAYNDASFAIPFTIQIPIIIDYFDSVPYLEFTHSYTSLAEEREPVKGAFFG